MRTVGSQEGSPEPITGRRFYLALAALVMAEMISSMEAGMIYAALPSISAAFPSAKAHLGWIVTGFIIGQAGAAALGSRLGDLYGRRRVLLVILLICALGSGISAVSDSIEFIIAGRVIQGVSGAILPLCYGIIRELAPRERMHFWVGIITSGYSACGIVALLLGGILVQYAGWHWIFYVTMIFSLIVMLAVFLFIPKSTEDRKVTDVDWTGGIAFVALISFILYGISEFRNWDPFEGETIFAFLVAIIACLGWGLYELRHPQPIFNIKFFFNRQFLISGVCFIWLGVGGMQLPFLMLFYLQLSEGAGGLGLSPSVAGLLTVPMNIAGIFAAALSGLISTRWSARSATIIGAVLLVLGWGLIFSSANSVLAVAAGMVLSGSGAAMILASVPNLLLDITTLDRSSEVTGLASVIRAVAVAVGTQAISAFLNGGSVAPSGQGDQLKPQFDMVFMTIFMINIILIGTALLLPRGRNKARYSTK